jgi:predicted N-formylglutamate amidohydrolase
MNPSNDRSEYVEITHGPRDLHPSCPVFLTCEHASARLPPPFRWPEEDAWLQGTHWTYDLGAAELTRELAAAFGATAVLSRFSRLLVDPNRDEDAPDLFRRVAEGRTVGLNANVGAKERELRLAMAREYHQTIDLALGADGAKVVLSIHTFTPVYEGRQRAVEIGVLYDEDEALAESVQQGMALAGFETRLNEPYSGKLGLIYSANRHAKKHGRRALELEVRQDLAVDSGVRVRLAEVLPALFHRLE